MPAIITNSDRHVLTEIFKDRERRVQAWKCRKCGKQWNQSHNRGPDPKGCSVNSLQEVVRIGDVPDAS